MPGKAPNASGSDRQTASCNGLASSEESAASRPTGAPASSDSEAADRGSSALSEVCFEIHLANHYPESASSLNDLAPDTFGSDTVHATPANTTRAETPQFPDSLVFKLPDNALVQILTFGFEYVSDFPLAIVDALSESYGDQYISRYDVSKAKILIYNGNGAPVSLGLSVSDFWSKVCHFDASDLRIEFVASSGDSQILSLGPAVSADNTLERASIHKDFIDNSAAVAATVDVADQTDNLSKDSDSEAVNVPAFVKASFAFPKKFTTLEEAAMKMSTEGVRLSFMNLFVETLGPENLKGKTTADICSEYVIQWTKPFGCSLVEVLDSPPTRHHIGEASWFISHSWSYEFLTVVEALNHFFRNLEQDPIIWFDMFSNSQHATGNRPFEWWQTTFMEAISKMRNVVMVCLPWNNPVTLTRAWCTFELFATKKTDSVFHVALTPAKEHRLFEDLESTGLSSWMTSWTTISTSRSQCFKPEDREMIFRIICEVLGENGALPILDNMVKTELNNWLVGVVDEIARNAETQKQSDKYLPANQGRSSSFSRLKSDTGEFSSATLYTVHILANLYVLVDESVDNNIPNNQDLPRFLQLYLEWCPKLEDAAKRSQLVQKYYVMFLDQAINFCCSRSAYEKAYEVIKTVSNYISKMPESKMQEEYRAMLQGRLAFLYLSTGRSKLAIETFEEQYNNLRQKGENYNPQRQCSLLMRIGSAYRAMGNFEKALEILQDCYFKVLATLGDSNPIFVDVAGHYGYALALSGKVAEGVKLLETAYKVNKEIYGARNVRTIGFAIGLPRYYLEMGLPEKADEVCTIVMECLGKLSKNLQVTTKMVFARVFALKGQLPKARELALEAHKAVFAPAPDVNDFDKPMFNDFNRATANTLLADLGITE
ncbi:Kinesin light chain 3 [Entophlyctis luteolus]|nr:Kinesin light chain 3 [Entophlyctis luteolus]